MVRYKVTLTSDEREQLQSIIGKGKHSSLQFRNACILLNSDEGEQGQKVTNVEHPEDIYSKPLKCGYNPYTMEWDDWTIDPKKKEAITFYNLKEI